MVADICSHFLICKYGVLLYTSAVMTHEELQSIKVEKQEKSTIKITGEIPFSYLEKHRSAAIKHFGKDMEIDGFRKGHVPEKVIIERVGEMMLLTEMAERALHETYPQIIAEHKLEVIGFPQISITKIAPQNPLGFSAIVAVMPEISLPDYFKIAKEINKTKESKEVTETELDKQIEDMLRQKVAYERLQEKAVKNTDAGETAHVHDENCEHDHEHEHTHDHSEHDGHTHDEDVDKLPLPELTDEFVKTLGKPGQFESVADFKAKLKEHMAIEKEQAVNSSHRAKITDSVIEKTTVDLPQVMIDAEINQMFAQMEEDLQRAQLSMEDYLGHLKKTKEDLKKEWSPSAEKRAKLQLILNEIAKKEAIAPDASLVDHEVSHLLERYKDADEKRVRIYVSSILTNEAVLKKLEEVA